MGSQALDAPHESVQADLTAITGAADATIPKKTAKNLLIGTWNVRAFDAVTNEGGAEKGDTPRRDLGDIACITEIVRRFDVVAIQEVRRSAEGFQLMLEQL